MEQLPDALISRILAYCSLPQLFHLQRTNKTFKTLSQNVIKSRLSSHTDPFIASFKLSSLGGNRSSGSRGRNSPVQSSAPTPTATPSTLSLDKIISMYKKDSSCSATPLFHIPFIISDINFDSKTLQISPSPSASISLPEELSSSSVLSSLPRITHNPDSSITISFSVDKSKTHVWWSLLFDLEFNMDRELQSEVPDSLHRIRVVDYSQTGPYSNSIDNPLSGVFVQSQLDRVSNRCTIDSENHPVSNPGTETSEGRVDGISEDTLVQVMRNVIYKFESVVQFEFWECPPIQSRSRSNSDSKNPKDHTNLSVDTLQESRTSPLLSPLTSSINSPSRSNFTLSPDSPSQLSTNARSRSPSPSPRTNANTKTLNVRIYPLHVSFSYLYRYFNSKPYKDANRLPVFPVDKAKWLKKVIEEKGVTWYRGFWDVKELLEWLCEDLINGTIESRGKNARIDNVAITDHQGKLTQEIVEADGKQGKGRQIPTVKLGEKPSQIPDIHTPDNDSVVSTAAKVGMMYLSSPSETPAKQSAKPAPIITRELIDSFQSDQPESTNPVSESSEIESTIPSKRPRQPSPSSSGECSPLVSPQQSVYDLPAASGQVSLSKLRTMSRTPSPSPAKSPSMTKPQKQKQKKQASQTKQKFFIPPSTLSHLLTMLSHYSSLFKLYTTVTPSSSTAKPNSSTVIVPSSSQLQARRKSITLSKSSSPAISEPGLESKISKTDPKSATLPYSCSFSNFQTQYPRSTTPRYPSFTTGWIKVPSTGVSHSNSDQRNEGTGISCSHTITSAGIIENKSQSVQRFRDRSGIFGAE
ncbi:hypothetical protein BKA69DRAFT_1036337 [Paraphysoderma sedebokerense]|nr:hypothetical protein BKA69DRAFT_1036337 [Paraphysoderma sedebokerense]